MGGGLEVKRLNEFNVVLLGKWCWRMLVDKEGLWYRVLKARYGEEGGRLLDGGENRSAWWRMMCGIRRRLGLGVGNWFEDNVCRVVGGGGTTYFWLDTWVGGTPLGIQFPRLFYLSENKGATVREMARRGWGVGGGAWEWRRRLLVWEKDSVVECSCWIFVCWLQFCLKKYSLQMWNMMFQHPDMVFVCSVSCLILRTRLFI